LTNIISGLSKSLDFLIEKNKTVPWFDGLFLAEEAEPVYGIGLVAFQNYIIGTVMDLKEYCPNEKVKAMKKHQFYELDLKINNKLTRVELTITLANYFKHRDEGVTGLTLDNMNVYDLLKNDFPINEGINLLDEKMDLNNIPDGLVSWRKNLEKLYLD